MHIRVEVLVNEDISDLDCDGGDEDSLSFNASIEKTACISLHTAAFLAITAEILGWSFSYEQPRTRVFSAAPNKHSVANTCVHLCAKSNWLLNGKKNFKTIMLTEGRLRLRSVLFAVLRLLVDSSSKALYLAAFGSSSVLWP